MQYELYPVTLLYWTNYYMAQWDIYASANPMNFELLDQELNLSIPMFKSDLQDDYWRFRQMIQVLDTLVLDLNSFRYDKREIVACLLYLQLAISFKVLSTDQIWQVSDL